MISATDKYLRALRHSHQSVIQVIAYEGSTEVGELAVSSVTLDLDATSDIQRSADIQVAVDPLTTESRDTLEALSTTTGQVVIKHGITFGGFLIEPMVTIATLRVQEMDWQTSRAVRSYRCFDRTLLLQEYDLPTVRPLNDTYTNLIQTLVTEVIPGEVVAIDPSIDTALSPSPGKSFDRGDDRLRRIQELAEAVGAWLVCEPDGSFALKPAPGTDEAEAQPIQWNIDQGEGGVLIDTINSFTRRDQYNAIGLEFTPASDGGDWSAYIFLWDNDPNSPTYFDGDFGRRTISFTEEYDHLPTVATAELVARRKLYEHSGLTRAIRVTGIYNPLLLPGDKIGVDVRGPLDVFTTETHFIERVSLSFGGSAAMDVDTRLSRLPGSYGVSVNGGEIIRSQGSITISGDATGVVV